MVSYIIICLEEYASEGTLLFWKDKGMGYTSSLDDAGLFSEDVANHTNKVGSDLALTKEQLLSIAKIYTVADCNLGKLNDVKKAYLKKVV